MCVLTSGKNIALSVPTMRQACERGLHRELHVLVPMLQMRKQVHSWSQDLNPDFSGSRGRYSFHISCPPSLVWGGIRGPGLWS